jgi:hypothetical protein
MHEQCIVDDALKAVYKRLGTDKPHLAPVTTKKEENGDEGKRPLSPSETGAEGSAEQSIDVKSEGAPSDAVHVGSTKDNVDVRQATADDEDAPAAPEDSLPLRPADQQQQPKRATSENTTATQDTPSKAAGGKSTPGRKPGRPRKKAGAEANGDSARPWEGLFEATLKTADMGPPVIEFRDLRDGVEGGEKTWTEPVKCLLCGNQVN